MDDPAAVCDEVRSCMVILLGVEVTQKPLLLLSLTRPLKRDRPGAGAAVQHRRVDMEGQSCDVWSRVREPAVSTRDSHCVVYAFVGQLAV